MATVVSVLYFGLFALVLGWAGVLVWQWRALPGFAGEVYDSNVEKGLLNGNVPRDEFVRSFSKAERPRLGIYQCGVAFLALVLLPLLVSGFYGLTLNLNNYGQDNIQMTVRGENLANILGDFITILIIMAINVALLAAVTFFYYRNRPPSLRAEIRRLEEQYK